MAFLRSHIKLVAVITVGVMAVILAAVLIPDNKGLADCQAMYDQGNYDKCIRYLEQEVEKNPDFLEARELLIKAQLQANMPVAALQNLVFLRETDDLSLQVKVVQALGASGQNSDGISSLAEYMEQYPDNTQARLLQTELQINSGKLSDAAINMAVLASQDISFLRLEDKFLSRSRDRCLSALEEAIIIHPDVTKLIELKLQLGLMYEDPGLVVAASKELGGNLSEGLYIQVKSYLGKDKIAQALDLAVFLGDKQWLEELMTYSSYYGRFSTLSSITGVSEAWAIILELISSEYSSERLVNLAVWELLSQNVDQETALQALRAYLPQELEEKLAIRVGLHPHYKDTLWILATETSSFDYLHEFVHDHEDFRLYYGAYLLSAGKMDEAKELLEPLATSINYTAIAPKLLEGHIVKVKNENYHYPSDQFISYLHLVNLEEGPVLYYRDGNDVYKYIEETRGLELVSTLPYSESLVWSKEGQYAYQYIYNKMTFVIYDRYLNIIEEIELDSEEGILGLGGYVFIYHWSDGNNFVLIQGNHELVYDCETQSYADYDPKKHILNNDVSLVFPEIFENNDYRMRYLTEYLIVLEKVDDQGQALETLPFYWINIWESIPYETNWGDE